MTRNATPKGFGQHDHAQCRAEVLQAAEALCTARGLKLTPVRRRVLEILSESHAAMGAYDILARLTGEGLASKPPVVYRALGFWTEQGMVHRIEKLNAFVACAHPGAAHDAAFLICRDCGLVAEAEPRAPLKGSAAAAGFEIESLVMEAEGLCPDCREEAPQ